MYDIRMDRNLAGVEENYT